MLHSEKACASVPIESPTSNRNAFFGIRLDILAPAILVILVSILRLPFLLWPHEMNPDESQMLSQAMKYLVDPVPWRGVDGTSGGPLNSYLISIFLLWGVKPGYIFVHLLADVLVCLQLVVAYRTLLRIVSIAGAMWGVLPMMLCLGFTSNFDFLHYSSELLPALFLAVGFHLFAVLVRSGREGSASRFPIRLFFCGLALGMVPWCKLQALPVAGVLVLAVSARIWTGRERGKLALSQIVALWLGFCCPER